VPPGTTARRRLELEPITMRTLPNLPAPALHRRATLALSAAVLALSACGGGDDAPPPADPGTPPPVVAPPVTPPAPAAPTITLQPVGATVTAGEQASFSVEASCASGTLATQWQRFSGAAGDFAAIAGATATRYSLGTALADNGAQFRAALSCGGDSTTSSVATLTVNAAPPPGGPVLEPLAVNGLRDQADISASRGIVREASGSFAFVSGNTVRRLAADLSSITLIAGESDEALPGATTDGTGTAARFNSPMDIAADGNGNLYVTEELGHTVRRITPAGVVTTLAGAAGVSGMGDGSGSAARFSAPLGIALGPDGDLYVADSGNARIRRVSLSGAVSTYAGNGGFSSLDGPAANAQFSVPTGIAVAADGTVYVSEFGRVRRIARSGNAAGSVATFAGKGPVLLNDSADGTGTAAGLPAAGFLALGGNTLYLRDGIGLLRAIDTGTAAVTTVAGTRPPPAEYNAPNEYPRLVDGPPGQSRLGRFRGGVAVVGDGSFILTDQDIGAVRRVDSTGLVTTVAMASAIDGTQPRGGTGVLAQQPLRSAGFAFAPIAAAPDGSLVIGQAASQVRRIAADGTVTTLVGLPGNRWNLDGTGSAALLNAASALAVDATGNIFFFDAFNIRRIDSANTTAPLAGAAHLSIPSQSAPPPESGAADGAGTAARFSSVEALVTGAGGELFAADNPNRAIRRIDAAGNVTTYAGALGQQGTADGPAATARFSGPVGLATPDGALWVLDGSRGNAAATLRRIAPDGSVSSFAGLAYRITVDPAGTLYAITGAGDLARVDPASGDFTTLIPRGTAVTLGTSPTLGGTGALAATGVKRLVLISDGQLLRAALP
jgi:sugar lactone lactonase YvrE